MKNRTFFKFLFSNFLVSLEILKVLMIVSENSHQNLSDYIQFLLKKIFSLIKKVINSSEKMKYSGNYI